MALLKPYHKSKPWLGQCWWRLFYLERCRRNSQARRGERGRESWM